MAASRLAAILMPQDGFAPSQTMPETLARVFVMVILICSRLPPASQVMAAPLAPDALTTPQKAESRPIRVFWWMVRRFASKRAG